MKSVKGIFRYLFPVRDGRELYWIKIPKGQSGRFGKEFIFEPESIAKSDAQKLGLKIDPKLLSDKRIKFHIRDMYYKTYYDITSFGIDESYADSRQIDLDLEDIKQIVKSDADDPYYVYGYSLNIEQMRSFGCLDMVKPGFSYFFGSSAGHERIIKAPNSGDKNIKGCYINVFDSDTEAFYVALLDVKLPFSEVAKIVAPLSVEANIHYSYSLSEEQIIKLGFPEILKENGGKIDAQISVEIV